MADLLVCSMCDHYKKFSPVSQLCATLTYQRSNVGELFVGGDQDGLDKELVTALRVWRWVFLHSLEQNYAHVSMLSPLCRDRNCIVL
jgi:hypothetical protein